MEDIALRRRSILIVENVPQLRKKLVSLLSESYRILEAEDGEDGIEVLKEEDGLPSLILMDGALADGERFLARCRTVPAYRTVPVLVIPDSENAEVWLSRGAAGLLYEPTSPALLLHRVGEAIRLREAETRVEALEHDSLSGLYRRHAFYLRMNELLSFTGRNYDMLMLCIRDFAHLALKNGEGNVDKLLTHIASRISSLPRTGLLCCRYAADRFVLFREHLEADTEALLADLGHLLHAGSPVPDFSVKYAVYLNIPKDVPPELLCDRLTIALETAGDPHNHNRSVAYCTDEMVQRANRLRRMEECMGHALGGHQFTVYYQPKVDCMTGRTVGAEALVRWIHPEYGFMSPGDFIPLFEENGFITSLDLFVWKTVCRDIRKWQDEGLPVVPVSVNASRRDFLVVNSLDVLRKPIELSGITPQDVHLEITESFGIEDKALLERVRKVRDAGIGIELDDFGSGHSSLSSILDIPMDAVKLDMSFVRSLGRNREVVRMMISLAHALGLKVIAEGVETAEQAEILRTLSCDMMQGFLFSRPLPEAQFREYMKKAQAGDAMA